MKNDDFTKSGSFKKILNDKLENFCLYFGKFDDFSTYIVKNKSRSKIAEPIDKILKNLCFNIIVLLLIKVALN